ncbi:hypothetical protein RFI_29610 [Reticulomyxa filosa]|uniref:Uncharacterized protein n=1 Tax=Reticulomyxa filosa TaxID=46433 RepID=X6M0U1_RETFI|nr:hypothetical protein RFI_29610 [Reticulomyxa filosa]|eukprot:ETO07778.1 hypothetical protein RFI_29610 [Reticulomyxa filosa]
MIFLFICPKKKQINEKKYCRKILTHLFLIIGGHYLLSWTKCVVSRVNNANKISNHINPIEEREQDSCKQKYTEIIAKLRKDKYQNKIDQRHNYQEVKICSQGLRLKLVCSSVSKKSKD